MSVGLLMFKEYRTLKTAAIKLEYRKE